MPLREVPPTICTCGKSSPGIVSIFHDTAEHHCSPPQPCWKKRLRPAVRSKPFVLELIGGREIVTKESPEYLGTGVEWLPHELVEAPRFTHSSNPVTGESNVVGDEPEGA